MWKVFRAGPPLLARCVQKSAESGDWIGVTSAAPGYELNQIKAALSALGLPYERPVPTQARSQLLLRQP
jgi:hypothetical protein